MTHINPVSDNNDKQKTYREYCAQYNRAIGEKFFFEAMLISYAMIEDRLRSYLYHIGALSNRKSVKINCSKTKNQLKYIVSMFKRIDENDNLSIKNISGKLKIIRSTLEWSISQSPTQDRYLSVLKKQYEQEINATELLKILDEISAWSEYRNEIIHALLNKNIDSLNSAIEEQTIKGMHYARTMDSFVKKVKKGNKIRKTIKLQIEKIY